MMLCSIAFQVGYRQSFHMEALSAAIGSAVKGKTPGAPQVMLRKKCDIMCGLVDKATA